MKPNELCPCLDAVFPATPAAEALLRLAGLGFRQFEFWDWRNQDVPAVARQAAERGPLGRGDGRPARGRLPRRC
ncbi:MAG: hypothetical protein XU14_C0113G0001, partial [Armatimonadetes bacterium CSP1-3]